jgi:hypothetical protein
VPPAAAWAPCCAPLGRVRGRGRCSRPSPQQRHQTTPVAGGVCKGEQGEGQCVPTRVGRSDMQHQHQPHRHPRQLLTSTNGSCMSDSARCGCGPTTSKQLAVGGRPAAPSAVSALLLLPVAGGGGDRTASSCELLAAPAAVAVLVPLLLAGRSHLVRKLPLLLLVLLLDRCAPGGCCCCCSLLVPACCVCDGAGAGAAAASSLFTPCTATQACVNRQRAACLRAQRPVYVCASVIPWVRGWVAHLLLLWRGADAVVASWLVRPPRGRRRVLVL